MRQMWFCVAASVGWGLYAATGTPILLTLAVMTSIVVIWPLLQTHRPG
jgi:hypothetical protein